MIPDATAIAAGSTLVNNSFTAYPLIAAVLAVIVTVWAGVFLVSRLRRLFGR